MQASNAKSSQKYLISKRIKSLLVWSLKWFFPTSKFNTYMCLSERYVNYVNALALTRGNREALRMSKLVRLYITRYLSGQQVSKGDVALSKGWPKSVLFLKQLHTDDIWDLRALLTILTVTRAVTISPILETKSIEDAWEGNIPPKWNDFRTAVFKDLGIQKRRYKWSKFHTTSKSGPNGHALMMSPIDALFTTHNIRKNIGVLSSKVLVNLLMWTWSLNGNTFASMICESFNLKPRKESGIRKLSYFSDSEGKTRVIGILDYWSQTVLRPIHDSLSKILKSIPEDCTFDQSSFQSRLKGFGPYYSFDLSNATDRLPVLLQKDIMCFIYGKGIADAWHELLVGEPFDIKGRKVFYKTGQPMGAYSSWPSMALTHHCIVRYAAKLVGINPSGQYVLLGDDIVIAHDTLAKSYKEVMACLDVPISEQKTHVSKHMYEFAKRWIYKEQEITPFPVGALMETWSRYYLLCETLKTATKRGYLCKDEYLQECLSELLGVFNKGFLTESTFKLLLLFKALSNNQPSSIVETIKANWKLTDEEKDHYSVEKFSIWFEIFTFQLLFNNTHKASILLDELSRKLKAKWPREWKLKSIFFWYHPLSNIIANGSIRAEKSIMDAMNADVLPFEEMCKKALKLSVDFPILSEKIIRTRSSHTILATHASLVKQVLPDNYLRKYRYKSSRGVNPL